MFRKYGIYICAIIGFSFATSDNLTNLNITIQDNSLLTITGTTNISNFKCNFNTEQINNPIEINYSQEKNKLIFNKTVLPLYHGYFDCGGRGINKDFKSLIKAAHHPKITLRLKEVQYANTIGETKATISIELAGVTNDYQTAVLIKEDGYLSITGNLELDINAFDLEAPKKAMGLIVVNNIININFKLFILAH
ncbi:hypothetical protein MWU65_07165 [Cellulophaga sp. F20128]|uniref:YceI family protein n=1 Tax=Cellulophaga sp. F20128 TaxID=2926413 RepID=UPI001FF2A651|nr:YceI family protein [Cellulophaga sp. F20128]MCK0156954.1 hypothetical protein [Cellulophaga sp. F20128]